MTATIAVRTRRSQRATVLEAAVRAELERRVADEPERVAARARVVLLAAEGLTDRRIAGVAGMHHNRVAVWRRRFATLGLAGLEDIPRPGRPPARGEAQLLAAAGRAAGEGGTGSLPPGGGATDARSRHVASERRNATWHWRARQALERSADGGDFVSRLLAEQDAGKPLVVIGVLVAQRCSAIAVLSCDRPLVRSDVAGLARRVGAGDLASFVLGVTRSWRDVGRLHVLVEQSGRPRRQGRGAGSGSGGVGAPLRLYAAGGRAAWMVQAELAMVLAGQSGEATPFGGLAFLRDHQLRTTVESRQLVRAAPTRTSARSGLAVVGEPARPHGRPPQDAGLVALHASTAGGMASKLT